jgi:hypothetical protein
VKAHVALFALATMVLLGGVTVATLAIHPSCPDGFYRNGRGLTAPSETGPVASATPCTSYATHEAPSSGVTIPRYATHLDPNFGDRLRVGIAALLLAAGLAGAALTQRRKAHAVSSEGSVSG